MELTLFLIHPIGNPYPVAENGSSRIKLLISEKASNVPICQNKALVTVDHVLAGSITFSNIDSADFICVGFPVADIVVNIFHRLSYFIFLWTDFSRIIYSFHYHTP